MDKAKQEKIQLREKRSLGFGRERDLQSGKKDEEMEFLKLKSFFFQCEWLQTCSPYPSWRMLGIPSSDKNKVIPQQPQNLFSENKFIRFPKNQTYHWFNQNLTFSVY